MHKKETTESFIFFEKAALQKQRVFVCASVRVCDLAVAPCFLSNTLQDSEFDKNQV